MRFYTVSTSKVLKERLKGAAIPSGERLCWRDAIPCKSAYIIAAKTERNGVVSSMEGDVV